MCNDIVITLVGRELTLRLQGETMATTLFDKPKRDALNLRIPALERELIDRAASAAGKTRTDFILEAARRAAEETLLDRALLLADPRVYADFVARLDRPAAPNPRLQRTMQTQPPWRGD